MFNNNYFYLKWWNTSAKCHSWNDMINTFFCDKMQDVLNQLFHWKKAGLKFSLIKPNSASAWSNTLFQAFTLSFLLFSSKHWLTVTLVFEEFQKTQENKYISYIIKQNKKIVKISPLFNSHTSMCVCLYRLLGYKTYSLRSFCIREE